MKNLKSVKIVKNTIDQMYNAITLVNKDDIDVILRINPAIKVDLDQLKQLLYYTIETDAKIEPIKSKEDNEPVEEDEESDEEDDGYDLSVSPVETEAKIQVSLSSGWLKYKPDAIWKKDMGQQSKRFKEGLMVSNEGDVWDILHDELLEGKFLDCEMKVLIRKDCYINEGENDCHIRIAPIVCRAFGVNSNTKNTSTATKVVIDYIDGDRRNLRPENLKWVKTIGYPNKTKILAEDVCRRLVEANGDIDECLKRYSESTITRGYISNIRNKLIETALSSKFFYIDNGKFCPISSNNDKKTTEAEKEKTDEPYALTNEPIEILESHIRKGTITLGEKNLMIVKTIEELQDGNVKKKLTAEEIVDAIRDKWKVYLPTDMAQTILTIGGIN